MEELLADFVAETREMLEACQGEIIAWEADPSETERLDAIFRFVHTVKGNCGFFDFPRLEKLSHAAEDALGDVRAGRRDPDSEMVSAVLAIIDRIGAMTDAIELGEEFAEGGDDALIAALQPSDHATGDAEGQHPKSLTGQHGQSEEKPGPAMQAASPSTSRTIRLPTDLLDRVMSGVSDMVLARNDLAHRLRIAGNEPTIDGPFERLSTILSDVRDAITRMRMQRIEHLFSGFPRLVRDLSNDLGKQVMIDFEGGNVELDREMIEMIRDPITHIIRNAVDHGFETPSERLKAGKREIGLLNISARQSGNKISVVITDDGRGLDQYKIAEKALAAGLVDQGSLAAMDREAILQLVFEPGLSTAEKVSSVSGRGVGLDVVRDNIERIGGAIKVTSTPGVGSLFYLNIPLTLSIITGITVELGEEIFAIPQSYVEEIVHLGSENLDYAKLGERGIVTFRGSRIPCLALCDVLGVDHAMPLEDRSLVMLRLASGDLIGMVVDQIHNITDLVVKPLPPSIMQSELYGGCTMLEDGKPIIVLDIPQIALNNGLISDTRASNRHDPFAKSESTESGIHVMVFKGFDTRRKAIRLNLVKRIEKVRSDAIDRSGQKARVVIDDAMLPIVGLDEIKPDTEFVRILRLGDGDCEIAYAVLQVEDAFTIDDMLTPAKGEDLIEGMAIADGAPLPMVDGHALFAEFGEPPIAVNGPLCSLPDNDWAHSILAPLVKACGYRVQTEADEEEEPAVAIVMDDNADTPVRSANVIRLHSDGGKTDEASDSIYRYDRDGLVAALKRVRATGGA